MGSMKNNEVMSRFNKYLNRSFFLNQDKFIRRKYQAYLRKTGQESSAFDNSFYKRMQ